MTLYLDTSAALKLLRLEAETTALRRVLDERADEPVISCVLLETELRRAAHRLDIPQRLLTPLLDRVELVLPDLALWREAGLLPGRLRSLDALHVATALRMDAVVVAYDQRLLDAAGDLGLDTISPT